MKPSNLLRSIKLLQLADRGFYFWQRFRNKVDNRRFLQEHPGIELPPDYLMFESFQINYRNYINYGKAAAQEILARLEKHRNLEGIKILDWGCGPGRIIRHIPDLLDEKSEVFGTDYNAKSIDWCKNHLTNIHFNHNSLEAKLPYEDGFFDALYGISIFTHLSEKMHFEWLFELYRVLKPNGLMYLTFQGDNYLSKMTPSEKEKYEKGELVVRGNVTEGHRTYSAFHPTPFVKELFKEMDILEHIVQKPMDGWVPQDVWIVRKK